jgi:hypothetical protein
LHEGIEEDEYNMSEFYNTADGITPSDFGNTPHSTFDGRSVSQYLQNDISFDYSTLHIEFMADSGQPLTAKTDNTAP